MTITIHQLPPESLSHIFAHLSPHQILLCTLVSQSWYNLIKDDSCWKKAFQIYFKIKSQEFNSILNQWEFLDHDHSIRFDLLNRIDLKSWRNEYLIRFNSLMKWKKSKLGTITYNPNIGLISKTSLNSSSTLTTISLKTGTSIKSHPWTGKSLNSKLESNPNPLLQFNPNQPIHLTNVKPLCFSLSSDGNSIVWGMRNGEIRISQIDPISGNSSVKQIGQIEDFHTNSIHCLKFIKLKKPKDSIPTQSNSNSFKLTIDIQDEFQEFIISCSLNGDVKIWSTTKSTSHQSSNCLGTTFLNNQADGLVNEIGTCISFNLIQDSKYQNILAIGTQTGSIHYWIGLSFFDPSNPNIFSTTRQYECINRLKDDVFQSVKYLEIESWKTLKPSILIQRGSHNFFERHWILNPSKSKEGLNIHGFLKYGTDLDSLGSLTCLDQDFHYPFQSNPDPKPINRVSKSSKVFNHSRWNSKGTEEETLEDRPSSNRVVAGDHQGKSYLWSWTREDFEVLLPSIKPPLICLQESGSLVTSICMTPMLIGIGGEDGSTKVYDALTGELLRLFRDKKSSKERSRLMNRGRLSEEEIEEVNEVYKVRSIELRSDSIVIGFGEWIMAWQVDRCGVQHKQKKEIRSKGAGRVVSKRIGSSNLQEIKDEVANRRERERIESELRSKEERWIERYHGELSEWMNEDEVFEYMKMISMEESLGNDHQIEEEWETWEMEEEEGEEGEERVLIDREDEEDEEARRLVIRASGSGEGDLKGNELNLKDWPMMNESQVRSQSSQSQNQSQSESAWKKDWGEVED